MAVVSELSKTTGRYLQKRCNITLKDRTVIYSREVDRSAGCGVCHLQANTHLSIITALCRWPVPALKKGRLPECLSGQHCWLPAVLV